MSSAPPAPPPAPPPFASGTTAGICGRVERDDLGDVRREAPASASRGVGVVDEREEGDALGRRCEQHARDARARLAHVERLQGAVAARELGGHVVEAVLAAHPGRLAEERRARGGVAQQHRDQLGRALVLLSLH